MTKRQQLAPPAEVVQAMKRLKSKVSWQPMNVSDHKAIAIISKWHVTVLMAISEALEVLETNDPGQRVIHDLKSVTVTRSKHSSD